MNLGFKQEFPWQRKYGNGAPHLTFFIEKVWAGIWEYNLIRSDEFLGVANIHDKFIREHHDKFGRGWNNRYLLDAEQSERPKIHSIRDDKSNKWKAGNKIDFWINVRTKNMFRFAPVLECTATQQIRIQDGNVWVDGKQLKHNDIIMLAHNDGFDSIDDFFRWFGSDYTGKIIHWTDKRY